MASARQMHRTCASPTASAWDRLEHDIGNEKNKTVLRDVKAALLVLQQEVRQGPCAHTSLSCTLQAGELVHVRVCTHTHTHTHTPPKHSVGC